MRKEDSRDIPGAKSHRPLVLIADDEADILLITVALLEAAGYYTVTATDGREALALFFGRRPDLVLLDLHMPGLDGYEFCRRVKGDPASVRIPVVLFSASVVSAESLEEKCRVLGADGFLVKPFTSAELLAAVEKARRK